LKNNTNRGVFHGAVFIKSLADKLLHIQLKDQNNVQTNRVDVNIKQPDEFPFFLLDVGGGKNCAAVWSYANSIGNQSGEYSGLKNAKLVSNRHASRCVTRSEVKGSFFF
jgi:hypothetical protein